MKKHIKSLALLVTVVMLVQALFIGVFTVNASAAVSTPQIANQGVRNQICTSISEMGVDYYVGDYTFENLSTQSWSTLENSLRTLMRTTHTGISSYNNCRDYAYYTDCQNGDTSKVITLYTSYGATQSQWGSWNREHVWPKSLGGNTESDGGSDLHHIRPSEQNINSTRNNDKYGNVVSGTNTNPGQLSGTIGGTYGNGYFEPHDNVKGDVARICLYVYVRWYDQWGATSITKVFESVDVLLEWCELDPVDTWEMGRNDVVQSVQGNRNVFIDYPEYAWLIFGEEVPEDMYTPSGEASGGDLPTPPTVDPDAGSTGGGTGSGGTTTTTIPESAKLQVGGKYVTDEEYYYNSTKYELLMTADKASAVTFDIVKNSDDSYSFVTDGKYLMADGTNVQLVTSQGDHTKFEIEQVSGGVNIKLQNATYNGSAQYLEIWSGYLTCYTMQTSNASNYLFTFADAEGVIEGGDDIGGGTTPPEENTTDAPTTPPATGESGKVSKTHTEIAAIAGVTIGQSTGVIAGKEIKLDDNITIIAAKGSAATDPCIYTESIRLYQNGNTLTIKSTNGAAINTVKLTLASNTAGRGPISVTGGTASALNNGVYTISGDAGSTEIVIKTEGTDKNTRVYVAAIEVVYAPLGAGGDDIGGGTGEDETTTPEEVTTPEEITTPEEVTTPEENTTEKPNTPSGEGLVVGQGYKIGLTHTGEGKTVYVCGGYASTYYLATEESISSGLVFYVEEANGCYYLYYMDGNTKTYVNMVANGEHVNAKYQTSASTVYTYDSTLNTLVASVGGVNYAFGTRTNKTFTTVGCYPITDDTYKVFFTVADSGAPDDDDNQGGTGEDNTTQAPEGDENSETIKLFIDGKYVTAEEYLYVNTNKGTQKYELVMSANEADAAVWTVIKNSDGSISFKTGNKFLFCDGTDVKLVSEEGEYTKFVYETTDGGVFIKCFTAEFSGKAQYLEIYGGYLTCYSMDATKADIYTFTIIDASEGTPDDGNQGSTPDDDNQGSTPDDGNQGNTPDDGNQGNTPDDGNQGNTPDDGNQGNTPDDDNQGNTGEENTTETPTTEPVTEAPTGEAGVTAPSTDAVTDAPAGEGDADPDDSKKGCKSAISGISAIIIAIAVPMLLYKKKKENE